MRLATTKDLPDLMRLAKEFHFGVHLKEIALFEDSEPGWLQWFVTCLESPDHVVLITHDSTGRAVGFLTGVMGRIFWRPQSKVACETAWWVSEDARGKGHGRATLQGLVTWARQSGAERVSAGSTQVSRPKALHKLLRAEGFRESERQYVMVL